MTTATATGPAMSRLARAGLAMLRLGVGLAELWLAHAWLASDAAPLMLIAVHFGIVTGFIAVAWRLRHMPGAGLWTDLVLLLLGGPLGAIGMIWRRSPANPVVGAARSGAAAGEAGGLSPADLLYASIVAQRRPRRDPENRLSLMDRVTSGDLASQQFAISMLSLKYQPELHPVLMAALQSPTPAVRVQAAAVFAKLRERFGSETKRLLTAPAADTEPLRLREQAAACRSHARWPFADDSVAAALLEQARSLEATLDGQASAPQSAPQPAPEPRRTAGEGRSAVEIAAGLLLPPTAGRERLA